MLSVEKFKERLVQPNRSDWLRVVVLSVMKKSFKIYFNSNIFQRRGFSFTHNHRFCLLGIYYSL
jgi:hypothetical protein